MIFLEGSVMRGLEHMKPSNQNQSYESNLTHCNTGKARLALEKIGAGMLRFLGILTAAVVIMLASSNPVLADPPVARDDSYGVDEDNTLNVYAPGILSNDTDMELDPFDSLVLRHPVSGLLYWNTDGSFTYTPNPNFNGSDSFSYRAWDGTGYSAPAEVTITVAAVNDVPSFTKGLNQRVLEDSPLRTVENWATFISKGAAEENGQAVDFIVSNNNNALFSSQPAISSAGTLTYTPAANANGTATVTVRIHDDGGTANGGLDTSAPQPFIINVDGVNDAPSFNAVSNPPPVPEDAGAQIVPSFATGMSAGPANEAGQTLKFYFTAISNFGLFSKEPDIDSTTGNLTYTPAANAYGSSDITIELRDNGGILNGGDNSSNSQTFTITVTPVNDFPVPVNDAGTTSESAILNVSAPGLLLNDTDVEGKELSVIAGSLITAKGALVTLNANGSYTYNPNSRFEDLDNTESTTDTFNYTVTDGTDAATGTVTITITGINDAPVASFTANPTSGTAPPTGLSVSFTDTSTDIDNAIAAWNWNFGDGTAPSTTQNPSHTYNRAGTFTVTLNVSDAAVATHFTTGTVTVMAGVGIDDVAATEGGGAAFNVSLTVPPYTGNSVTVNYATANGSAAAGADYSPASGALTFNAGESVKPVSVAVINDTRAELAEDFYVNLSSPSANAVINDNQGRCEIAVDDVASISINDVTVDESAGTAVFTVTLDTMAEFIVPMGYASADNTAVAGSDYTVTSGNMAIAAGDTSGIISVPILNPVDREPIETFFVNLSNLGPGGGPVAFSKAQGIGTIIDNDVRLTIVKQGTASDGNCKITASAGSVSGAGGNSGLSFVADYDSADVVTLNATDTYPTSGSVFKGWSGDAGSGGYTTTVAMTSDKTVTATFNATHTLSIDKAGSGAGQASVTSGPGSDPRFPGGTAFGTYLYEQGSTVTLAGTDNIPTAVVTGSQFAYWDVYGDPGAGFNPTNKNTTLIITGDLSITGNFTGLYMITSLARTGGTITPVGSTIKVHGASQSYTITAFTGNVHSDTVIDGFSQGAVPSYTFDNLSSNHEIIAVFQSGSSVFVGQAAGDEQIYTASAPPIVLLVMGRDHKLYYEAYNDSSDLDGNGTIDVGYKPAIDYYGYFDSYKVYKYDRTNGRFYPVRITSNKKVDPAASDEWSGDFLNYLTMSRMDALRKVLYGGYRSTDEASLTVLERAYIPQDAHSWGKEYHSLDRDDYDIAEYTPLNMPAEGTRHLFASTNLGDSSPLGTGAPYLNQPLLRVLPDSGYRVWEWVSIDRPVAGDCCFSGDFNNNGRCDEDVDGNSTIDNLICEANAAPGNLHPPHPTNHRTFELMARKYGDPDVTPTGPTRSNMDGGGAVASGVIDGTGNPFGRPDNFLTIFKANLWIKSGEAGNYRFAVTGGDAVEVLIDGVFRANAGHYGVHANDNSPGSHSSGAIYMPAGKHSIEFRHEFQQNSSTDTSSYQFWWQPPWDTIYTIVPKATFSDPDDPSASTITSVHGGLHHLWQYTWNPLIDRPASLMEDYKVRVVVADPSMPESNCKQYPNGNYKPIGLLQRFGEPGKLHFGLLTGSYEKHLSGGVLRKNIGPLTGTGVAANDEINTNTGQFTSANGIIKTIDKLRITGFTYSDYSYSQNCGWVTSGPITQGTCKMWGNPIAEMMYEGLRYFAAQASGQPASPTTAFDTNSGTDVALGLPHAAWDNPFLKNACAKPFMLVISDINPSYDSDQLPGALSPTFGSGLTPALTSFDTPPEALNVETVANEISGGLNGEGITGSHYIGQVASAADGSCSPKNMTTENGFGRIRGLCPEEPTKLGSYYSPSVAHFGRTHDISASAGEQNLLTYVVGLASPLPRFEIRASNNRLITLVPFAKTVADRDDLFLFKTFKPTNSIVDFYIEFLSPTTATFRVNFEDVEQGADHDMDAIAVYSYELLDDNDDPVSNPADGTKLRVTVVSEYAAGTYVQHMGYIISGTTADGTYLEVRDTDTLDNQDMDYFLDTPPGSSSPATYEQWYDRKPLPLVAGRLFTVGSTTAATLLNDPLWYAAKWGGFVDQDDNKKPNLQSEWDADGDGTPDTYYYVVNPLKLEQQLTWTFYDIMSRGVSHVAPVASVDEANRTQSGDKLYMAFFKPMDDNYWQGNLKKYGLDYVPRDDCGRLGSEWTVVDANGTIASLCDGTFKASSQSYWSAKADGGSVDKGGAGGRLKARMPGSDPKIPASPYYSWRNIYTYKGALDGSMVPFTNDTVSNTDLEVTDDLTRFRIINFMYGYTYDAVSSTDSSPLAKREWILGDIIHSEPRVIDYFDEEGELTHRFVAVGANDGMLHVFVDGIENTTATVNIGGTTYSVGDEIFAFIPRDLLHRLQEFNRPNTHLYTVDGSPAFYRSNTTKTVSGTERYEKTLVFGERAGGRSYWALDVTAPDPSTWKVKWHIEGGASGAPEFQELGYTWSKPIFTRLRTSETTTKEVAIFSAGYDPIEDGFPEGFDDQNKNGQRDTTELHGVTSGGTEGYDKWNPGMDSMGRGIFVVDLSNGHKLFEATYGDDDMDGNEAEDVTTGTNQKYAKMKYCFPADISVIPLSDSQIIMYAADVYGQVWRIRYDYFADLSNDYTSASSAKWTVKRIFTANPGSGLASGNAEAFPTNTLVSADAGRKMFYSPDVSLFGNDWTGRPVLYFGTGDRQHAKYTMISNRIYFVSDTGTLADETDLLNLTCNELDDDATIDADTKTALRNILEGGLNSVRGLYRVLDKQGACADDDLDHTGEHILSQPTVFGGVIEGEFVPVVYFTSYQPVLDEPCNPAGNAFVYALNASFGTSALNYDLGNDTTETKIRTLKDTYRFISGGSIPSGVRVIMRDGHAAGLISAGGAAVGVGEEGSTTIPGPPGGITPLLWETD